MQTLSSYLVQWSPLGSQWCNCVQRPKNLQSDIQGKSLSLCVGSSPSALGRELHLIGLCFPYSGWLIPLSPCPCIWRHPHRHTHNCACVNYSSRCCDQYLTRSGFTREGLIWFTVEVDTVTMYQQEVDRK